MAAAATVRQLTTPMQASGTLLDRARTAWRAPGQARRGPLLDADTQIVERCLRGEEAAWEDLVKVHTRRVYSICYRFTGSDAHAQDLTQDVFMRVFRSLKKFRTGEGSFMVWLCPRRPDLIVVYFQRPQLQPPPGSFRDQPPM